MALLQIDLQDGFHEDDVRISAGGKEIYRRSDVTTRVQTGLADTCQTSVPEGETEIEITLPSRNAAETLSLNVTGTTYLGVSLSRGGGIVHRVSGEPFRYV